MTCEERRRTITRSAVRRQAPWLIALVVSLMPLTAAAETGGDCGSDFDQTHAIWNGLVKQYVKNGSVSYGALKSGGRQELNRYLGSLEAVCPAQYQGWNQSQKLAFWINAYNAYTVDLILDNYPTSSIMKIAGGNGAAFKQRFIPLGHLAKRGSKSAKIALNDVENNVIRKQFREPRIHFALVCASKSCPPLRSEAYRGATLSRQLEAQTRAFIRDSKLNRYDASSNTLSLSRIFEWYGEDFQRGGSTVPSFVARYLDASAAAAIKAKTPRVTYLDYDWSLNGR